MSGKLEIVYAAGHELPPPLVRALDEAGRGESLVHLTEAEHAIAAHAPEAATISRGAAAVLYIRTGPAPHKLSWRPVAALRERSIGKHRVVEARAPIMNSLSARVLAALEAAFGRTFEGPVHDELRADEVVEPVDVEAVNVVDRQRGGNWRVFVRHRGLWFGAGSFRTHAPRTVDLPPEAPRTLAPNIAIT